MIKGFGRSAIKQLNERADWNADMKEVQLLSTITLSKWVVILRQSKRGTAGDFIDTYGKIISSLGIIADAPDE